MSNPAIDGFRFQLDHSPEAVIRALRFPGDLIRAFRAQRVRSVTFVGIEASEAERGDLFAYLLSLVAKRS